MEVRAQEAFVRTFERRAAAGGGYYLQSSALVANGISPLLVKQITISSPTGSGVPAFLGGVDALDYGTALADFAAYQAALQDLHPHDLAILLTHRPAQVDGKVEPAILEAANRGSACSRETGAAIAYTGHSLAFDASVVAHALGHVLGMCHDPPDRDASCPGLSAVENPAASCAQWIMAPTSDPSAPYTEFSACSASDLDTFLESVMPDPSCLAPPVVRAR